MPQPQTGPSALGTAAAPDMDGAFSLADAAEELSLHMAHKVEEKRHSERKFGADKPLRIMQNAEIIDARHHYHEPDIQTRLVELTRNLLGGREGPRKLVSQSFKDVTQQYLSLQFALNQAEKERASSDVLDGLRNAIADMELESGPQIRAGLNALPAAGAFAQTGQAVQGFVDTYRDVVLGESTLSKTLSLAMERFGGDDLERAVGHLIQALGVDLAATHPSTHPERLTALVSDLYQLEVAATVLESCNATVRKMVEAGCPPFKKSELMHDLVSISASQWVDARSIENLADKRAITVLSPKIAFLNDVRNIFRGLPLPVYPNTETRNAVLNANQAALDIVIAQEDEA
ncbi:hypothetical protein ACMZ4X_03415 [Achromobacter marplatensis]